MGWQDAPVLNAEAPATAPAAASGWQSAPLDEMSARQNVGAEAPRRSYTAGEVPAAALKNLPKSAGKFVGGIYEAVTSPIQTAKGLIDVGAGAIQNVLPQGVVDFVNSFSSDPANADRAVAAANAVGGMFKDRYGDYDSIKRTLAEDPVGAAADLSTLFSGGALATTKVPAVSTALTKAATVTNPLSVVTKPVEMYAKSKNALLQGQKQTNVVRDANLLAAQKEGYVVTPGSLDPTGANILKERIAGKTHLEQLASIKNQATTDNLARKAVGLPENAQLTPEVMKGIREAEYTKGYAPLKNLGNVVADDAYLDDLAKIEATYTGPSKSFPEAVPDEVGKLISKYTVDRFDAADAVDVVKNLREQASANFRKGENALAKSQLDISTALEGRLARALETSGDPSLAGLLEQFKASRQRMAVSHTVEEAIRKGSGSVDAKKLARDIQNDKFMTGDLKTAAEFANTFPRVNVPPSMIGTPGAGTILGRSLSGAAGAGAGFAAGGGIGAVIGAAAPELISAGMREYMLSRVGQKGVAPKYNKYQDLAAGLTDEGLRNALLATQAGSISRENKNKLVR
jgi:hypothetical protein